MSSIFSKVLATGILVLLAIGSSAHAQATRTWVSGVGDDVNPCSRTAPCKTFAGAISKTAAGGEINAMDDGGYGSVTITKSMTINGGSHLAGILAGGPGVNGVVVNAGANDVVILRNLNFTGSNGALNGVRILAARYVVVEDSTITGFANGINMAASVVNGRLDVRRVTLTNGTATANTFGIHIGPSAGAIATISNVAVRGFTYGLTTRGGDTYLRDSDLVANDVGYQNGGGQLHSMGNNMVVGNTSAPTQTLTGF
jgi:hypothetical protein